jgi:GNAT superfamily N-acetyltransferase
MLTFKVLPSDRPPASELLEAMVAETSDLYGGRIDAGGLPTAAPSELAAPHGAFLVGFDDGEPVCSGGVKRLADGLAEIKRMYVVPEARSRGLGRALLAALEDAARDLGYTRVRLDTGALQPGARSLYERSGYRAIADYNGNAYAAFWGEKDLAGPPRRGAAG